MTGKQKIESGYIAVEQLWDTDDIYRFIYLSNTEYRVQYKNIQSNKIIRDDPITEQKLQDLLQKHSFSFYES